MSCQLLGAEKPCADSSQGFLFSITVFIVNTQSCVHSVYLPFQNASCSSCIFSLHITVIFFPASLYVALYLQKTDIYFAVLSLLIFFHCVSELWFFYLKLFCICSFPHTILHICYHMDIAMSFLHRSRILEHFVLALCLPTLRNLYIFCLF